jgi:hypothetical protein
MVDAGRIEALPQVNYGIFTRRPVDANQTDRAGEWTNFHSEAIPALGCFAGNGLIDIGQRQAWVHA